MRIIQHVWAEETPFNTPLPIVDLVFADPPYNYGVCYADDLVDARPEEDYRRWCRSVMAQCAGLLRPGGTLWWLCPAEHGGWVWEALAPLGTLLWDRPIIWHERFSQYQRHRLTADYRLLFPVVVGGCSELTFTPAAILEPSERQRRGDPRAAPEGRVPGHVWTVRRLQGTATARVPWHPAQLPPEPLERIVRGWTHPGDVVLDAFAGSGSMGMVCKRLHRQFVGIDGSRTYCEQIWERLREGGAEWR